MYSGSLAPLKYEEFIQFLNLGISEGVHIEYKTGLSDWNIPRTVASFANTMGGSLILGVKTDEYNRPITPPIGFCSKGPVEDRIRDACYTGIYPPVRPEIGVADIPEQPGKKVAVIRVTESPEAPHAIANKTLIFVREASTTRRIKLAEIDRIQYLLERRKMPEEKRKKIIDSALERAIEEPLVRKNVGFCYYYIVPLFPYAPLCHSYYELINYDNPYLPRPLVVRGILDGICEDITDDANRRIMYFEINKYGLLYGLEMIEREETDKGTPAVNLSWRIIQLINHLRLGAKFYEDFNYFGYLECAIGFENVRGRLLYSRNVYDDTKRKICLDNKILVKRVFPAAELHRKEEAVARDLITEMAWCFDAKPVGIKNIFSRLKKEGETA